MFTATAESVTAGHPDKLADQISDAILDDMLAEEEASLCAVETMIVGDNVFLAGEVSSPGGRNALRHRFDTVRRVLEENSDVIFDEITVHDYVRHQSQEIFEAVAGGEEVKAGDQGIVIGYATNETPEKLPLEYVLARDLSDMLTSLRLSGENDYLRPDGKTQVTLEGLGASHAIVSTQHSNEVTLAELKEFLTPHVLEVFSNRGIVLDRLEINPAGRWVSGGSYADTGLTGRKIVADTYGPRVPHGGGSFSGKDATKVDRSGAYAARQAAIWLVENDYAEEAKISLAYMIGQAEPTSISVQTTQGFSQGLVDKVYKEFDFTPEGMFDRLELWQPIYEEAARLGSFGRPGFTWEQA